MIAEIDRTVAKENNLEPGASHVDLAWNSALVVAAGVGWQVAMAFMNLLTIIPVMMRHMGASDSTVGALIALYAFFFSVTGLLFVRGISKLPLVKWRLFRIALLERTALLPLALFVPLWGVSHPKWGICAVFVCIAYHTMCMGSVQPAYWAVFSKIIPVARRGRLSGITGSLSGVLAFCVVGAALHHLLSGPNGGFPDAFGRIFLIGSILFILACMPFAFFREPTRTEDSTDPHAGHAMRDGLRIWHEHTAFRRFLCAQIFMVLATLASPFFVLYANNHLNASAPTIAGYTAAMVIAQAVGSLCGGFWSDRAGNRALLIAAISAVLLANVCAITVTSSIAFYVVFILNGMALYTFGMASNNIVMEFAPQAQDVPLYTTVNNLVMAFPRTTAPLLAGFIAQGAGDYRVLFATAMILAVTGLTLTLRTSEPRRAYACRAAEA